MTMLFFFGGEAAAFQIVCPAFQEKKAIPQKYTCDGSDASPPLVWSHPPEGTQSFALIADDPEAPSGVWVHWLVYDISVATTSLEEGLAKSEVLPNGAKQGMTDFRRVGYGGPCPPTGKPHPYFFKLYALDSVLNLPPKATKADLLVAMTGHVLAQADLVGTYEKA